MLKEPKIAQIIELYEQGISQRKIAKRVGVARESVRKILNRSRNHLEFGLELDSLPIAYPSNQTERCNHCGALVFLPCLACTIRNLKRTA